MNCLHENILSVGTATDGQIQTYSSISEYGLVTYFSFYLMESIKLEHGVQTGIKDTGVELYGILRGGRT